MLDRTKVLYGPRTQTYREISYLKKKKKKVLDKTKVLRGPRILTHEGVYTGGLTLFLCYA